MQRETRKNRVKLTEEVYQSIANAWKGKQDLEHVSDVTGLLYSTVKAVVTHGIPELALPPLPKSNGNGRSKPSTRKPRKTKPKINGEQLQKATLLAHEEAIAHVDKAKKAIQVIEQQAREIGAEVDLAEQTQIINGTMDEIKLATKRANLEEKRLANVEQRALVADATKRSAGEAALARQSMDMCLNVGAVMSHVIDKMLEGIENGNINLPTNVDIRTLSNLASSADRLTSAIERAIKIEKGRAGEPDTILGVQIGVLLNSYSDAELESVIETGALPAKGNNN